HAPVTTFRRLRTSVLVDRELPPDRVEKFFARKSVEILNRAVVREYAHLRVREDDGENVVVILTTGVREALLSQLGARTTRTRSTMMTVCDIKQRHRFKALDERLSFSETPDRMTNTIRRSQIK